MTMQFMVLASGSAGNSSFLRTRDFGLLIDVGLGPRQLQGRLAEAGLGWADVGAVLLTHTHTDHWHDRTLAWLAERGIPFYCHANHGRNLAVLSRAFAALAGRGLVRGYEPGVAFEPVPQLSCLPFGVQHDSTTTCGFRFECRSDLFGRPAVLAYAADLGCWDAALVQLLANADALALEFNHDVTLQRTSGRSRQTIARNLGNKGHLSNEQAAALLGEVLRLSESGVPKHLIQLHLSRDCNREELALAAVHQVLARLERQLHIHTAAQDRPGPLLTVGESAENNGKPLVARSARSYRPRPAKRDSAFLQALLPGWEE